MAQEKYLGENGLKKLVGLVKEDLGTKANIDGSYDTMQVGSAKQIVSPTGITDTTPYVFRTTCGETSISGGDEQLASLKAIRGNTIVWNQCIQSDNAGGKELTIDNSQGSSTLYGSYACFCSNSFRLTIGHKYLIRFVGKISFTGDGVCGLYPIVANNHVSVLNFKNQTGNVFTVNSIESPESAVAFYTRVGPGTTLTLDGRMLLFDLTQMFGPGNEPTSVLEFARLFPKPYYPFNAGEIRNAKTTGLKTTGYNACSGIFNINGGNSLRSEIIKAIAGQTYVFEKPSFTDYQYRHFCVVTADGTLIRELARNINTDGALELTLGADEHYLQVRYLYYEANHYTSVPSPETLNTCVHVKWSGSRTGYAPHEEHVLEIDTSRYFPDGMNGIGGVYDELTPKRAIKRFGKVDLGTLEWSYNSVVAGQERFTSHTLRNFISKISYMNIKCAKYETVEAGDVINHAKDKIIANNDGYIQVYDSSYTDETTFKQAMSGVYLIYPLAEPVVTEIPQVRDNHWEIKVDDYGTEEWLFDVGDEIPVPVGHETLYMDNLVDKLRNLPEPSDYEALESEVQTLVKLPPLPTDTTKVYVPKFVNGTIQWVEE